MGKDAFFCRPKTISEIVGGKEIIECEKPEGLAAIIGSISASQAVIVKSAILPEEFRHDEMKFLKYGLEAVVNVPLNIQPRELIAFALKNAEQPFCAVSVLSRQDYKTRTRFILDDCIAGMKIYAYAARHAPIEVKNYSFASKSSVHGGKFVVSVPSRKPKGSRYTIRFANVPVADNPRKNILWTEVNTSDCSCSCEYKRYFISYRHEQERIFCPHEIAAYIAIASKLKSEGNLVPAYSMPFPVFSERVVLFWNKLKTQVLARDSRNRMLNKAERALLIGDYIKHIGIDNALDCRGKKLVDFLW